MHRHRRQTGRSEIWWIIPGVLIAALAWYFYPVSEPAAPPTLQKATLLPQPRAIADFHLVDHHGRTLNLARLRGHWSLLFFGYTHCPDVCPTTLQTLATTLKRLEAAPGKPELPQVIFISVDPQRDTPERLAAYVPYFDARFLGATGKHQELEHLARQVGIVYAKSQTGKDGDYLVDHSAAIVLFDPDGRMHAVFGAPHDPATLAADLQTIQRHYASTRR